MTETSEPQTKAYHSDGTVCPGDCDWQKHSHAFKGLKIDVSAEPALSIAPEIIKLILSPRTCYKFKSEKPAPVPRFKTESDADYVQRLREGSIG